MQMIFFFFNSDWLILLKPSVLSLALCVGPRSFWVMLQVFHINRI